MWLILRIKLGHFIVSVTAGDYHTILLSGNIPFPI